MGSISRPITEFCLDLYNKLNRNAEDTNIIFSPMSISVALALVHLGAKNNTAAQIEKVSINETCWDASTLLAVPLMEMLNILAWHVCEGPIGNKHEYKHRCCLQSCAWCAMILVICLCELRHAPMQTQGHGARAEWEEAIHHSEAHWLSPSLLPEYQTLFQNYGQALPLVVAMRILKVWVWVGSGESCRNLKWLHLGGWKH